MGCDLVFGVEAMVTKDHPAIVGATATDIDDGHVLVVVEQLREPVQ